MPFVPPPHSPVPLAGPCSRLLSSDVNTMLDQPLTPRGIFVGTVTAHRTLCDEHFEITLGIEDFPEALPGQFLQVLCRDPDITDAAVPVTSTGAAFLRRPFSIGGLRRRSEVAEVDLLGRVIGPGTAWLNCRNPGDKVNVIGPLGRSFSVPDSSHSALLVSGGIGLPPVRWHTEFLRKKGISCFSIFGARERRFIPLALSSAPSPEGDMTRCADEFTRIDVPAAITTDDGSCGLRGRVTDAMERFLATKRDAGSVHVFACGPEPMLRAVASLCLARGIPCELAMERVMACGMGTCQSCVVPVFDSDRTEGWRYSLCCTEGPVYRAADVKWD